MEKNKYICPDCGSEMIESYLKPALTLTCPHCGCKIATSRWDDIDLDNKEYEIIINSNNETSISNIKFLSKILGANYINCKQLLINGGSLVKADANKILKIRKLLEKTNIRFDITPKFPY